MTRSSRGGLGVLSSLLLALFVMVGSARADITFPVMIRGVIYTDNAPPVRVNCSSKEGNTVTFVDGDVSVSILPIFSFDPTCELHSAQGVFTDGERFNGEVIDEEIVVTTVTNKRGAESFQEAVVLERIGSGSGMVEMVLECMARFPVDKATQTLQPPLRSVQGKMMLMNDSTDEIFVGTWRTGKRK